VLLENVNAKSLLTLSKLCYIMTWVSMCGNKVSLYYSQRGLSDAE
jgi:hypothetical protein